MSNRDEMDDVDRLMDGPVREALGISSSISFGGQSGQVFNALSTDFMKPVTSVGMKIKNTFKAVLIFLTRTKLSLS